MRLHRFYVHPGEFKLQHDFWLHDERLINQWNRVLRFQAGQEVVLFDGVESERLYKVTEISDREAHLELVTDFARKLPSKEIYLFWSLLKKDKNDWVLQKCTELGVSHFVPLLADRCEKTGFNEERAQKIVIEAAEQCGRSDLPTVREPIDIKTAILEFSSKMPLFICEQNSPEQPNSNSNQSNPQTLTRELKQAGVFVGPEGGWSDPEKELFKASNPQHLNLHDFTLRAETACVSAIAKLT